MKQLHKYTQEYLYFGNRCVPSPAKRKEKIPRNGLLSVYIFIFVLFVLPLISLSAANYSSSQVQILTSLRDNEKQLSTLSSRVRYLMDNYAALQQKVNNLEQSLSLEKQNNQKLNRDISTLKRQLSEDRKQVQKSLDNVIDKVANETSKAINAAVQNTNKSHSRTNKSSKSSPTDSGFFEYKVQPGATLSAIAKAYDVSISSLRKANKIDNDLIRVGQILYIPKK